MAILTVPGTMPYININTNIHINIRHSLC
jgi:hypothetical protein